MPMHVKPSRTCVVVLVSTLLTVPAPHASEPSQSRVEAALNNIVALHRPGQDGLATVWDGNKYIQCRRMPDQALRCESAGTLMQPSLGRVLVAERIARLAALGWHLDPSFGNYVQTFPYGLPPNQVAERILQTLKEAYDADLVNLEVQSDWISSEPCPPRNGPTQNLAGMINDSPAMAETAVYGCTYRALPDEPAPLIRAKADLINIYGARLAGEIQRLRVNIERRIFVVADTGGGYIQCGPQTSPPAIYCETQSAESWPVLARILTPPRVAQLHAAGFADPGRAPNYSKTYPLDTTRDSAIADELLTLLHDVYGYNGVPNLIFSSEKGRH
jgi:hypothetical protein